MTAYRSLLLASALTVPCVMPANVSAFQFYHEDYTPVATLSVGPAWSNNGRTQTFFLQEDVEKTYQARKESNVLGDGELFLGLQKAVSPTWLGQLGVAVAVTGNANLQGDVWEDADPDFNNFFYQYNVMHSHVAIKGKLIAPDQFAVQPFVAGSVGVGFNRSHDFTIISKIFEEVAPGPFAPHTETAFTYTVGAGIQKPVSTHCVVGLGYEFADWGKSHLGRAPTQTMHTGPSLSHLYTNSLQFNFSYLG